MGKKVTFYIPVYNVEKYISSCIESVLNQTYPIYEFLIIDDGSQDNSIRIAESYKNIYPKLIKIIKHNENKGLACARNTALYNADGEILATIDTDAVADKFFLENIMKEFEIDKSNKIAGVCGRLIESNIQTIPDRWRARFLSQHWGEKKLEPIFIFGSTSVFKISALKEIGGFDPKFKTNGEDCDISERLKNRGFKILYNPEAIAYHQRKDNLKSLIKTFYNWVVAPFKENMNFRISINRLKNHSYGIILKFFADSILKKEFDLLYPTFLSAFYWPIADVLNSLEPEEKKNNTITALLSMYSNLKFPDKLKKFVLDDIKDLIQMEYGNYKLNIFNAELYYVNEISNMIKSMFKNKYFIFNEIEKSKIKIVLEGVQ